MPIPVQCRACKSTFKAPDTAAGREIDCPRCGGPILIPKPAAPTSPTAPVAPPPTPAWALAPPPVRAPQPLQGTIMPTPPPAPPVPVNVTTPMMVDCPFCAEPILAAARKCKHCGEMLDLNARPAGAAAAQQAVTQVIVQQHVNIGDYRRRGPRKSVAGAALLAFFFGPLGMLYSTVVGALALLLTNAVFAIPTGFLILLVTWPVGVLWAMLAAISHNDNL